MVGGVESLRDRYRREPGLRERKKRKAMRHIQDTALRLFAEHGFTSVTIERVADEAEVSPSTVYRYFGTKEQLVLYDEADPDLLRRFDGLLNDHAPVEALRRVLSELGNHLPADETLLRTRIHFVLSEPSVRKAMGAEVDQMEALLRDILAIHTGLGLDSLRLRVFVSSMVHALIALIEYWHDTGYREPLEDLVDETFTMLASLEL
ncbi:transcriptional regulator, TetR family [Prauserella aidingensis]|uniref:TetR/AcrR family transcriptional regulator n=1 Tax=Prauserella aidingensis TaxID=387890 RepID=UPI0020A3D0AD|nr:TetR/AcrR family transcriptional regulator [Prauserella aidingensis]MCP2255548.1 transcriptional regulator, TetR family [Prauserella aidingensis]